MTDLPNSKEFSAIQDAQPNADGLIECPLLPLIDIVVFPHILAPIDLMDGRSVSTAEAAIAKRGTIICVADRNPSAFPPNMDRLFQVGTEVALGRIMHMPDGSYGSLGQGRRRVEIVEIIPGSQYPIARARVLENIERSDRKTQALMQAVTSLFRRVIDLNENLPEEMLVFALNADDPGWLADLILSSLTLPLDERQRGLEALDTRERLQRVAELLGEELSVLELKDEIADQIQQEMDRTQREVYLREQMRVIQTELGEEDIFARELNEVREQIVNADLSPEARDKATKEMARLAILTPMAPEIGMVRTYIDWLTSIPWTKTSEDRLDVKAAHTILERDHYGLPKVKDRILEYIAVRKLAADKMNSPILCFVGPPGVGKTSLGKSIASALGREFVRVSLGGVRDEAEIRGHRRTYIGALPGRIIQTMKRAGTINPVFMLDEIDKLGNDFRGDPAAALLETLDPEQNGAFSDHYLDVPYDLSKVLFITTANDLDPLPPALLDRLEVIEFTGYTEEEKIAIARQFLIPKQLEAHGLIEIAPNFHENALKTLIREYTYEAGVRNLNREIANVLRKIARQIAESKRPNKQITSPVVEKFLGPPLYDDIRANDTDDIGVATGLAWTPFGGDILTIEVSITPGKGALTMTGSLGDVMQESAQTAMSYMRAQAETLKVPHDDFEMFDVHVHLPEGAVPKDGPSAGITLAVAIISAFTERRVRHDLAMTGEITLRGKILPVGGVKEKILAARRARIKTVLLPRQNVKDLIEIPKDALKDLEIILVDSMQTVLDAALIDPPQRERRLDRLRKEREDKDREGDGDDSADER
ncbi:MAG: endopeptidase La [Chloroflexota bacterium]|nr:endopeptidase La [Chloroflexota bacterium]